MADPAPRPPMVKTFVGPRLRQLRREAGHTQVEMASRLGVSPAYINLMEHNQRNITVRVLVGLLEHYGVDWRDMVTGNDDRDFEELRKAATDPVFGEADTSPAAMRELRQAGENAPMLAGRFVKLHAAYSTLIENMMRLGHARMPTDLLATSVETVLHDFFRDHSNHFPELEDAAAKTHAELGAGIDDMYLALKNRADAMHGITVKSYSIEDMEGLYRKFDYASNTAMISEGLDHVNRVFMLANLICRREHRELLDRILESLTDRREAVLERCREELANYFAAALIMPYDDFLAMAVDTEYDIDRIAARFGTSFEQVCHRLTTLQKESNPGIPFFFLRVDKAGNVTKRFNSTSFRIAEYGGSCPVWNMHTAFRTPGVVVPQFVELPDGARFFTMSRTTERPALSRDTQDRRLVISLGCSIEHAEKLAYARPFVAPQDDRQFSKIGINCHLCPRSDCAQRAHEPLVPELNAG